MEQNEIFRENQFHTWSINSGNIVPLLILTVVAPLTMYVPRFAQCHLQVQLTLHNGFTHLHLPTYLIYIFLNRHWFVKNEHAIRERSAGKPVTPRL